jgi:hypothetical protein
LAKLELDYGVSRQGRLDQRRLDRRYTDTETVIRNGMPDWRIWNGVSGAEDF